MKLSIERANELLNKLGVNAQVVEADKADADVDIESIATEYEEEKKGEYRSAIEGELKEPIEKAATAKVHGSAVASIARTMGLNKKDILGIEKLDDLFVKVKELYDAKSGSTKQEWEAERQRMQEEHDAEIADKDKIIAEKETAITSSELAWQTKYDGHFINSAFLDAMAKTPRKGGDVSKLAKTALIDASDSYDFKYNHDTKAIEAYDKKGKLVKDFDINNHAVSYIEGLGLKATDTRDLKPSQVNNNPTYQTMQPKKPVNTNPAFANIATELND